MTAVDWDSVGQLGFDVADRTARSVARAYADVEEDDVYQEALIYLATHVEEMDRQYENGAGLPGVRGGLVGGRKAMIRHLSSRMRAWASRQSERFRLEAGAGQRHMAALDTSRWSTQSVPAGFEGLGYQPALIEALLPSVWNMDELANAGVETAPDPDMPRAASDPSHAGTHMAHYADIREAWAHAPLTTRQRQALVLRYGIGLEQEEAASAMGISRSTVREHIDAGIQNIATHLNGKEVSLSVGDHDLAA